MHKNVRNRLLIALTTLLLVASGIYILLYNLSDNIVFFLTPSEIKSEHLGRKIRLGGLVKKGSVEIVEAGEVLFVLTDEKNEIRVKYKGILPALFRENQGMVAEGLMHNKYEMISDRLLTKHDENYKPPDNKENN